MERIAPRDGIFWISFDVSGISFEQIQGVLLRQTEGLMEILGETRAIDRDEVRKNG